MPFLTHSNRQAAGRAAAKAYRAAGRAAASPTAAKTDQADGRVHCRCCGSKVRSGLGDVCSRTSCQQQAALSES